jgi:hypothetical protein
VPSDPDRHYKERAAIARREADRLARADLWSGRLRVLIATLVIVAAWYGQRAVAAALAIAFVALVFMHSRTRRALRRATAQADACAAGVARVRREWTDFPAARHAESDAAHESATARDLDLAGPRSLLRLLDVAGPFGTARLEEWLLGDPADVATIGARQQSVRALRERPELLLDAAVAGQGAPALPRAHLEQFLRWGTESGSLRSLPRRAVWVVALCVTIGVVAAWLAGVPDVAALLYLVVPVNLTLAVLARLRLQRSFHGLDGAVRQLEGAVHTMRRLSDAPDVDGELGELQRRLRADQAPAAFASLQRLLSWNEVQYSPMMHWVLNAVVAFDAVLIEALGWWGRRHGARTREWFRIVGDAEALLALGALAFENPSWIFPVVHDDPGEPHLSATAVRHPLLSPAIAVGNDAELREPGDVLVISGSNMSGKTTFLRAVGTNVLLANLGGPVAAETMTVRRTRVRTSVRVADDLSAGISLFLAEVRALREVVSAAERPGEPPVLFLLDEILHGTNTADRRAATRDVLTRLSAAGASGIVTTHDPEIALGWGTSDGAQGQDRHVVQRHFRDALRQTEQGITMTFDYRAHDGPATTSNAQRIWATLMENPSALIGGRSAE